MNPFYTALMKQAERDRQRAQLQMTQGTLPLDHPDMLAANPTLAALLQDERPLDSAESLANNPTMAALLQEERPLDSAESLANNPTLRALLANASIDSLMEQPQPAPQQLGQAMAFERPTNLLREIGNPAGDSQLRALLQGGAATGEVPAAAESPSLLETISQLLSSKGASGETQALAPIPQEEFPMPKPMVEAAPLTSEAGSPNEELLATLESVPETSDLLAPTPEAPKEASRWDRFKANLAKPENQELLLQTFLGLARGEDLGTALGNGIAASRTMKAAMDDAPMAAREREAAVNKLEKEAIKIDAETGKLSAETNKLLSQDEDKMDDASYTTRWNDLYKNVTSGEFLRDDTELSLDSSELTTKLFNQNLKPENRRYQQLTETAEDRMRILTNEVASGKQNQNQLASQLRMYSELIYGPEATARMVQSLRGGKP